MALSTFDWVHDYPAAISVCDTEGTIIALNRRATENFHRDGGERLVGTSLPHCPTPAPGSPTHLTPQQHPRRHQHGFFAER